MLEYLVLMSNGLAFMQVSEKGATKSEPTVDVLPIVVFYSFFFFIYLYMGVCFINYGKAVMFD